jgi:GT2 family glycosyltransferase
MDQLTSANVSREMISKGYFDGLTPWGLYQTIPGHLKYYEESIRLLHSLRRGSPFSLLGCNFSIHKSDLRSINGFDESYEHRGGGEDTDICYRLKLAGFKMKSVRYLAIQFHLGHEKPESKDASAKMFAEKRGRITSAEEAKKIKSALADDGRR